MNLSKTHFEDKSSRGHDVSFLSGMDSWGIVISIFRPHDSAGITWVLVDWGNEKSSYHNINEIVFEAYC